MQGGSDSGQYGTKASDIDKDVDAARKALEEKLAAKPTDPRANEPEYQNAHVKLPDFTNTPVKPKPEADIDPKLAQQKVSGAQTISEEEGIYGSGTSEDIDPNANGKPQGLDFGSGAAPKPAAQRPQPTEQQPEKTSGFQGLKDFVKGIKDFVKAAAKAAKAFGTQIRIGSKDANSAADLGEMGRSSVQAETLVTPAPEQSQVQGKPAVTPALDKTEYIELSSFPAPQGQENYVNFSSVTSKAPETPALEKTQYIELSSIKAPQGQENYVNFSAVTGQNNPEQMAALVKEAEAAAKSQTSTEDRKPEGKQAAMISQERMGGKAPSGGSRGT